MFKHPQQRINVAMNSGGLGDRIAQMTAIIYCLKTYDHVSMDIYCPKYFMPLAEHFLLSFKDRVAVYEWSGKAKLVDPTLPAVGWHNMYHTTLRTHLVDHAFRIMNDSDDVPAWAKNYPRLRLDEIDTVKFNLPERYVVLTPGYTAPVRKLSGETYNAIARWIERQGFTVVWLGARADTIGGGLKPESSFTEDIDYSIGRDLRDQTTLLEAGKIMALSECVLGVDNGLLHLAACSSVTIVAGYTSVDPKTRLPYRNNMLGWNCHTVTCPDSVCRFIQTKSHFNYQADFRECLCGTYECVNQLTSDKFIERLERIL